MQSKNQLYIERVEEIPMGTENEVPGEPNIVTLVSRRTKGDIHSAESRRAGIYQQALSILPDTSENARRADYIAASIIVTILGNWLGGAVLKSRVFTVLIYVSLVVLGAVLAGIVLGALLGWGFIPIDPLQVFLFTLAGIAVLVLAVGLSLMLWSNREDTQPFDDQASLQQILIPVREANPLVVIPVREVNPQVIAIPVKELNPRPQHAGRRKTD